MHLPRLRIARTAPLETPYADGELLEGDDKAVAVRAMFDRIAPRYDLVNRVMTFRLDVRWRRQTVDALGLPPGALVLDLACGTGDLCEVLFGAGHTAVGVDFSLGMLIARHTRAPVVQADVTALPVPDAAVDAVTCGFALRNLSDLAAFFAEVGRVVRPGGRVAVLDAAEPDGAMLRFGHDLYFNRVVPRIGGWLSDRAAYEYLPRSLAYLPEPAEMLRMLDAAGFVNAERRLLTLGGSQLLVATRA